MASPTHLTDTETYLVPRNILISVMILLPSFEAYQLQGKIYYIGSQMEAVSAAAVR